MKAKNFQQHLEERLDHKEVKKLEKQAHLEQESLQILQRDIVTALARHMQENSMGFNDVTKGLGISPAQTSKILKGRANLTCASLAHIAAFLGKKPHLIFH